MQLVYLIEACVGRCQTSIMELLKTITFTLRGIDFLGPLPQNSDTYLFYFKSGSVTCAIQ